MSICWIGLHSWKTVLRWSGVHWFFHGIRQCSRCGKKKDFDAAMYSATEYYR